MKCKTALYIIPNLNKVSGGPKTRASNFKEIFLKADGSVYEAGSKAKALLSFHTKDMVYVESATNRITFLDFLALIALRLQSKNMIVFIRDIYIELFPEEYVSGRGKITLILNKVSYYFLTSLASFMVFPTKEMGAIYFNKNKWFPIREYSDLPPAAHRIELNKPLPDFTKKTGILYLGSLGYTNSGYQNFLNFSKRYATEYNFFILSGDSDIEAKTSGFPVQLDKIARNDIPRFIESNNIAYAFHTRPINQYDEITYPIKVFDFLSFQLPFISERHKPICTLLGNEYPLFASYDNLHDIYKLLKTIKADDYRKITFLLMDVAKKNTYEERYKKLLAITNS